MLPAAAIVTLIGVAVLVAALAGYLIWVAVLLRDVTSTLQGILGSVVETGTQAAPIGQVTGAINADLEASAKALTQASARVQQETNGSQSSAGVGLGSRR